MNREWDWLSELLEALEIEDYLLLAAVLLLPWAFGGVEIWAYRSASLLLAAAAAVALFKRGAAGLGLRKGWLWLLPAFLLGAWATVQLVPLPPGAIRALSPEADRVYREVFPGYGSEAVPDVALALEQDALSRVTEVEQVPDPEPGAFQMHAAGDWGGWKTLSVQPSATAERLFWYLALLLGFLLAAERTADPDRWRIYRTATLLMFAGLAMVALLQTATWNGKVLWIRPAPERTHPFGPYISPTHLGGAMELAVAWLAGYTWAKFRRPEGKTVWGSIAPVAAGATALCFITALVSGSKAATLLVVISLSVISLMAVAGRRGRWATLGVLVLVWGSAGGLIAFTPIGQRVQTFLESQAGWIGGGRVEAWQAGLKVFEDYWLTGTGFGSFREVFPAYVPPGDYTQWAQLHNDYLEVLLDGGVVAGVLVLWLLVGFLAKASGSLRRGRRRKLDVEAFGLFLGILALMAHAFVDFNHQIPANALLFVVAAGMLLSRRQAGGEAAG